MQMLKSRVQHHLEMKVKQDLTGKKIAQYLFSLSCLFLQLRRLIYLKRK